MRHLKEYGPLWMVIFGLILASIPAMHRDWMEAGAVNVATSQPFAACGRLTLQTGAPVMATSSVSATTVYYTPYGCDRISLYNGSDLVLYEFSEISNLTTASSSGSAGPAAVSATQNFDMFVWNKSGSLTLTRGPAWTNATTRSLTLSAVHGVYVNGQAITNGPASNRGLFVGTFHSAADATVNWQFGYQVNGTNGSAAQWGTAEHDVWNMYNRVLVAGTVGGPTTQWTYNSTTIRAANARTDARLNFVIGINDEPVYAQWGSRVTNGGGGAAAGEAGVGLDSTTSFCGALNQANSVSSSVSQPFGVCYAYPGIGTHFMSANEGVSAAQTVTFAPSNPAAPIFAIGIPYQMKM